ncbi:MAG: hypothetical protein WDN25_28325 [Acetobacteraceae bacterium]
MPEPWVRLLDAVHIDDDRQFIEFRFRDFNGDQQAIQIDFEYVETLAALFQQAFVSAALDARQGGTRRVGEHYVSVPRVEIDHPVNVGVDVMSERVIAMFLLGSPFQVSYALSAAGARMLAGDLMTASDEVRQHDITASGRPVN